ncbi:hypothetical protein [Rhizobium laguerreae]|uniref:hypothetical protein n=1 Tax=Rhizobium laguerreae TaxID=1076926 RepID=UPI001C9120F0|nr:hypothetical protein [Rhizobium laguerreae]MBY3441813.1 hypothetical protein [Rhizobium laguerreae]
MAWAEHDAAALKLMVDARLDFTTIFEEDHELPPVFFNDIEKLTAWAKGHELNIEALVEEDIVIGYRVSGFYKGKEACWGYDKLWVQVDCDQYRKALQRQALSTYKVSAHQITGIHADHIINRARLCAHPKGWVCLFPVPGHANTNFGSTIEKKLQPVPADIERIDLSPLVAFKLFCGIYPRTESQLKSAMRDIRGQWHTPFSHVENFIKKMEADALPFMRDRRMTVRKRPRGHAG